MPYIFNRVTKVTRGKNGLYVLCTIKFQTMFNMLKNLFKDNSAELQQIINDNAFLVDVRTPGEFKGGSVPGAVNIPLDTLQNNLAKFKGKKNIVVFCASGMRSSQAKSILERNGIQNVYNGGSWSKVNSLKQ
ncbi:MAG: rhodanese-like domain-containing protein [Niabella sp.]